MFERGMTIMFEFECLTETGFDESVVMEECSPYYGECYPVGEDCCGPECNPSL